MKLPRLPLTLWAGLAAFGTYFCAYGLRKPFTATDYAGAELLLGGLDFKVGLVIAQVLGYALSKFIGIRLISELRPGRRTALLLGLVAVAELALIGFGLVGDHWLALPMRHSSPRSGSRMKMGTTGPALAAAVNPGRSASRRSSRNQ